MAIPPRQYLRDDSSFVFITLADIWNALFPGITPPSTPPFIRTLLTAATTYYVATNGSDSNNGLTPATAWLTFAHAIAVITGQIDFGGQAVTLQAVAGHAAFTTGLSISPWVGGGSFIFDGGGGSITTTNAHAVFVGTAPLPGTLTIQNVSIATSGSVSGSFARAILVGVATTVHIGAGVSFGTCSGPHIQSSGGASVFPQSSYTITGGAQMHWLVDIAILFLEAPQITITLTGAPAFSIAFAYVTLAGAIQMDQPPIFSGSATGPRFNVNSNGILNTGGSGVNLLPGSVAGSTSTGGQYT